MGIMQVEQAVGGSPTRKAPAGRFGAVFIPSALAAAVVALFGFWYLQSSTGDVLVVDSTTKSFGVVGPGGSNPVSFRLTNLSGHPIRIVGCESGCGCIVPDDLPFSLSPKESRSFTLTMRGRKARMPGAPQTVELPVTLFTTEPSRPLVRLTVKGDLSPAPNGPVAGSKL